MTVQIKYCGCQTADDYVLLSSTKADIIGFVFAKSKREVKLKEVSKWVECFGKQKKLAGVFKNASAEDMIHVAAEAKLDIIQCHGDERPETLLYLKKQTGKTIYKAIPFSSTINDQIALYSKCADAIIVDSVADGQFGGTGVPFSWNKIPLLLKEVQKYNLPVFIAGGINSENVKSLLDYNPYGIDLSGGIEKDGKKCAKRITELEGMM
jgi:phosphoribosylanthranilate isomerase